MTFFILSALILSSIHVRFYPCLVGFVSTLHLNKLTVSTWVLDTKRAPGHGVECSEPNFLHFGHISVALVSVSRLHLLLEGTGCWEEHSRISRLENTFTQWQQH